MEGWTPILYWVGSALYLMNNFNNEFLLFLLLRPTTLLAPSLTGHSSFRSSWSDPSLCSIWFLAFSAGKNTYLKCSSVGWFRWDVFIYLYCINLERDTSNISLLMKTTFFVQFYLSLSIIFCHFKIEYQYYCFQRICQRKGKGGVKSWLHGAEGTTEVGERADWLRGVDLPSR